MVGRRRRSILGAPRVCGKLLSTPIPKFNGHEFEEVPRDPMTRSLLGAAAYCFEATRNV